MKKLFIYFTLISLCAAALSSCVNQGLETDQFGDVLTFSAMAPNPVMRGGELRIVGSNLEQVTEVRFAGEVTVTDIQVIQSGRQSEIRVLVPMEGPEVGPVTVVGKDGKVSKSFADLSFTEPIEVDSFSPATVLSGDVLTFKGEYLNDVLEVIFTGEAEAVVTEFVSQSRHELQVVVPSCAISGPVILSDVNELVDENTIPNHVYTKTDLAVGDPTVDKAAKAVYKSGDVITVTGAHLDMIKTVDLPQAAGVDFTVAGDGKSVKFNLAPTAVDGNITLTSYAGVAFDAGEIETVNVKELSVKSLASDSRFKANTDVEISGTDLDLVSKVEFTGAEANWYLSGGKIVATIPAAAQDGPVTVTLESGKQAFSEDLEVVKPVILSWDVIDGAVAGQTSITVKGSDLDLVEKATIGTKAQGLIDCEFSISNIAGGVVDVLVKIPEQAYTGPITLTSAAGYSTSTENITVVYDMAVSIDFDQQAYGLGSNISITGRNLLQIEQVFVKGKKVTSYAKRTDDAMAFGIPEGVGPGVYRLGLILIDGTELTWPVPFEITAPFTETFIWEGYEDMGSWTNQPYYGADGAFADAGLQIGDIIRIYYTPLRDGWQFQIFGGHWEAMTFPEAGGTNTVSADNTEADAKYFAFEVTDANFGILTGIGGWGGAILTQGEGVAITGVSFVHFGAAEQRTTIWEGNVTVGNWDGSMSTLSWGGYDWSTVEPGTKLAVSFTATSADAVMRFGNGSWASLPSLAGLAPDGNLPIAGLTSYEFELTAADLDQLVNAGGLVICGAFWTITEVTLVTVSSVALENVLWEGSEALDSWVNQPYLLAEGALAEAGMQVGDSVRIYFTTNKEEWIFQVYGGHWEGLNFAEVGGNEISFKNYDASAGYFEFKVTEDIYGPITGIQGWGGSMVVQGDGVVITKVTLP